MADADRFEQESGETVRKFSRQEYNGESVTVDNQTDRQRDTESNEFTENRDNGFRETGWEDEREYLFNGKGIEEDEQYIGRT